MRHVWPRDGQAVGVIGLRSATPYLSGEPVGEQRLDSDRSNITLVDRSVL
jgi:hypothetical protein